MNVKDAKTPLHLSILGIAALSVPGLQSQQRTTEGLSRTAQRRRPSIQKSATMRSQTT